MGSMMEFDRLLAVPIFGLMFCASAIAQDIKCDQVFMNPSEKQICGSEDLLRQDAVMGELYRRVEPHVDQVKKQQREFRRGLKSCKGDVPCLESSYGHRIEELKQAINTLPDATQEQIEQLSQEAAVIEEQRSEDALVRAELEAEIAPTVETSQENVETPPDSVVPNPETVISEVVDETPDIARESVESPWWLKWLGVGAAGIFLLWLWGVIQEVFGRCPKCKQWRVASVTDSDQRRHTEYETKTFTDVHRDKNYNVTGRTEKRRQVRVNVVNTTEYLKCRSCQHEWSRSHTRRSS